MIEIAGENEVTILSKMVEKQMEKRIFFTEVLNDILDAARNEQV